MLRSTNEAQELGIRFMTFIRSLDAPTAIVPAQLDQGTSPGPHVVPMSRAVMRGR